MKALSAVQDAAREQRADHLAALLTLAAGQEVAKGACPLAEELSDLLEGRLPESRRVLLLQHLDQCQACYRAWLGGAALLPAQAGGTVVFLSRWREKKLWGSLALAAGLLLIWVQWNPLAPEVGGMVAAAYRTTLADGRLLDQERAATLLPGGETLALGFVGSEANPVRQAYLAGLQSGRERLQGGAGNTVPQGVDSALVYYPLGQWLALLQGSCQLEPPPQVALLRQQAALSGVMLERLRKRESAGDEEARIAVQEVESIRHWLTYAGEEGSSARLCRELQKACTTIHAGFQW
ncbi:MAG: hypothetical protein HQM04_10005 [Magnetococcales bacterium]|nr:hypothetical protein [Magnetococcales bacterium]MBF0115366.1 hypothetical protein [Magnetococcales bacterium]